MKDNRLFSVDQISEIINEIADLSEAHKFEALTLDDNLDWKARIKYMHESKASAYDFVVRKLKRKFQIPNNGKETGS